MLKHFEPCSHDLPLSEVDYSRQVTGYIRSLHGEDMAGRKRGYEERLQGMGWSLGRWSLAGGRCLMQLVRRIVMEGWSETQI